MEDKKDFDKDKQEMGTQQMPHVPTEGDEDGKKGIIVLFGHEFDKRKAVMAGLGGLLAIALIGGGVWYAASQKPEPKESTPIEQTEKQEQQVIQLGAKADADALNAIVKSVGDAVKKGDGTLTGANGTKVIELVKENAKANPNADKDKVDEESQKSEEDNTEGAGNAKPDNGGGDDTTNAGGGSGTQNQGGGGSSSGGSGNGGDSEHTHNWVPQTTTIHHDAQYQTIHHDAITEEIYICNNCGANITGDPWGHINDSFLNGDGSCGGYHSEWKVTSPAWDETKEVSPAWDETITTYKCSGCPATK